ncbi:MAG: hypothetical protein V4632_15390, partial [Pseudomonadota bacterium]
RYSPLKPDDSRRDHRVLTDLISSRLINKMKKFQPPRFHDVALIGDNPYFLAELSAMLAVKGTYLAVVDGPRLQRPDADAELTRRNNAFARVKTKKIVMADLSVDTIDRFAKYFPRKFIYPVNNLTELDPGQLAVKVRDGKPIRWGNKNIGIGLLKALNAKTPIQFVDAQNEEKYIPPIDGHLVVCEEGDEHAQVVAANYAYSIGAGLFLIPEVDKEEAEGICEEFYSAYEQKDESFDSLLQRLEAKIKALAGDIPMAGLRGITFISKGIPWGYAIREVPSSHLFGYPDLGIAIINGVASEQPDSEKMRIGVVVDPQMVGDTSEVVPIAKSLAQRGYLVRGYRGDRAKMDIVNRMMEHYPYDFLLIATHCGDASGYRETYQFKDSEGKDRELVLDTALATSFVFENDKVEVRIFQTPVSLDGVDWKNKPALKKIIGSAMTDFYEHHKDYKPVSREKVARVPLSAGMQMYDGNIILAGQNLAGDRAPIILNNACVSWHQLAMRCVFADARVYIGTITPVIGPEAEGIADKVINKHFGKHLSVALWHAQNEVYGAAARRRPYVMVGVHYQRLTSGYGSNVVYLNKKLKMSHQYWKKKLNEALANEEDRKANLANTVKFLEFELLGLNQR